MIRTSGIKDSASIVTAIWLVSFADFVLPGAGLSFLGIVPREISGLLGIVCSAFIHGSLSHLVSNTPSLFFLLMLLSLGERRNRFWLVVVFGIIGSGAMTWMLSSGGRVVGASGLVFVLIGYLLANCMFNPNQRSLPIGLITIVVFGGSVVSMHHFAPQISLSAHFGGLVAGVVLAKVLGGILVSDEKTLDPNSLKFV